MVFFSQEKNFHPLKSTPLADDFAFTVPDMINVGLVLEGNAPDHYVLQLKSCWATPRYESVIYHIYHHSISD